jgi:hypothetical protein
LDCFTIETIRKCDPKYFAPPLAIAKRPPATAEFIIAERPAEEVSELPDGDDSRHSVEE